MTSSYWFDTSGGFPLYDIGGSIRTTKGNPVINYNTSGCTAMVVSAWFKKTKQTNFTYFLCTFSGGSAQDYISPRNTGELQTRAHGSTYASGRYLRDPAGWYHIYFRSYGQNDSRNELYLNGEKLDTLLVPRVLGDQMSFNGLTFNTAECMDGYISNLYLVMDSTSTTAVNNAPVTEFGEFYESGTWMPKPFGGSLGNRGCRPEFRLPSPLTNQASGSPTTITTHGTLNFNTGNASEDCTDDTPLVNFAVINSKYASMTSAVSNGGLTSSNAAAKPTILDVPKPDYGWDGTEAGWNRTGDVDFGQRSGDPVNTSELPESAVVNAQDHFKVFKSVDEQTGFNDAVSAFPNYLVMSTGLTSGNFNFQSKWTTPVGWITNTNYWGGPTYASVESIIWAWNMGPGSLVSNGDGNITTQTQVNNDAGMSYVTFSGNGSTNQLIGHGLGKKPGWWLALQGPSGSVSTSVAMGHHGFNNPSNYRWMHTMGNVLTDSGMWDYSGFTDKVAKFGNKWSGTTHVFFFAETPGFSKMGKYTANNSADGPYCYCGHKPAFILCASEENNGIQVFDTVRNPYNPVNSTIEMGSPQERFNWDQMDINANGWKNTWYSHLNNRTNKQIYVSFAEQTMGSNVPPPTAR